jgi:hypothetical protein
MYMITKRWFSVSEMISNCSISCFFPSTLSTVALHGRIQADQNMYPGDRVHINFVVMFTLTYTIIFTDILNKTFTF